MSEIPASQRSWWRQPPLWVGAVPLLIFLLVSAVDLALAKQFTEEGKAVVSNALGGIWQWMVVLLFLIAIVMAISPVGRVRLGGVDAKPSLKFFDWCAVLICTLLAGGGVFWSAAEPLSRAAASRFPSRVCTTGCGLPLCLAVAQSGGTNL